MRRVVLLIACIAALAGTLAAQTWQFRYGLPSENERGAHITRTPDGGYLVRAAVSPAGHSALLRLDADGDTLWVRTLGPFGNPADPDDPLVEDRTDINADGAIFSVFYDQLLRFDAGGHLQQAVPVDFHRMLGLHADGVLLYRGGLDQDTLSLRKYAFDGTLLWEKKHAVNGDLFDVKMAPDGKVVTLYAGVFASKYRTILRVFTNEGEVQSTFDYRPAPYGKIAFDAVGNYILYETILSDPQALKNSVILMKCTPSGTVLWEGGFLTTGKDAVEKVVPLPNGGLLLLGTTWESPVRSPRLYVWSATGNEVWRQELQTDHDVHFTDAVANPDLSFVVTGSIGEAPGVPGHTDALLWQFSPTGILNTNLLRGRIRHDRDTDCALQIDDPGLANWKVLANQQLKVTDAQGWFEIEVPPGTVELSFHPPRHYWAACPGYEIVEFTGPLQVADVTIPAHSNIECPMLEVSVGFPRFRRCFKNTGTVSWCNIGTKPEANARVLVVLPPELDFESATLPVSSVNGDSLWFDIGLVEVGACGSFYLTATVNCDNTVLGQSLCVSARIFPDTFCITSPNWSGASLRATAQCQGDTLVEFVLRNVGTAPTVPNLGYIIIEDQVVLRTSQFGAPLLPGGEMLIEQPVANGNLYRLQVEQEPNHPGLSSPAVWVEGCGGNANQGLSLQYPVDDADHFIDITCMFVIGAYDPNDKAAHPEGYAEEHYIEPGTDLTYRIRFQNTGTDTAFTVIIRDTLSEWLDPLTVRPQTASHPFVWDFVDGNVLKFTFPDILLPDSTTNEPASNGFVEFRISQKPDVPLGTIIRNDAAIYFDFNPPIITNEVFHTVGREFITVHVEAPEAGKPTLRVQPNPFREAALFRFDHEVYGHLSLYSPHGQLARQEPVAGTTLVFQRQNLAPGLYFFDVRDKTGRLIARGKVIAQ